MSKRKRNLSLYITAFILFAGYLALTFIDKIFDSPALQEHIKEILGIISAFIFVIEFLGDRDENVKKLKDQIHRFLRINKIEGSVKASIGMRQREEIKGTLLSQVDKDCKRIIDNIEKSSPLILSGNAIETELLYFETFEDFKKNGPAQASITLSNTPAFIRNVFTGNPGNGKTYHLIKELRSELDKVLKERDAANLNSKIPVYLSLSSWQNEISFDEWLEKQLSKHYTKCTPANIKSLIAESEIFPFVDGLDEVDKQDQLSCFTSLIEYANGNSIIFSCRKKELLEFIEIISSDFIGVSDLQTLSKKSIIGAIKKTKENSTEILSFLNDKPKIFDFINTPLILNLFVKVFDSLNHASREIITTMDQNKFEIFMWEQYDDLIFKEKYNPDRQKTWPDIVVRTYITQLAKKMKGSTFQVEQLQPSWLGNKARILLYYITSRVFSGLVLSIGIGFFLAGPGDFIGNGVFASLFIAIFSFLINPRENKFYTSWKPVVIFTLSLIVLTGVYQGFAVPRKNATTDTLWSYFSLTESYAGILLGIFLGVIFGYRKSRQNAFIDIQPLDQLDESFKFSWRKAVRVGFNGGICLAFFLGLAAIFIRFTFPHSFFDKWLDSNIETYFGFINLSSQKKFLKVGIFGFTAGLVLGFIVFALMGGRDRKTFDEKEKGENAMRYNAKFSLNHGILKSFFYSLRYGFIVMTGMSTFYGLFIYLLTKENPQSVVKALNIGIGTGIISLLWFGGFEVIQHWCLRLYLYFFGIAPLRYSQWIKITQNLAFISRVGMSLQFYHENLKQYFSSIPENDPRKRIANLERKKSIYLYVTSFVLVSLLLTMLPFFKRYAVGYSKDYYWKSDSTIIRFEPNGMQVKNDTLITNKPCRLNFIVGGKVKVGTFSGYSTPKGIELGLLGLPLGDTFSLVRKIRHGALMFRQLNGNDTSWKAVIPPDSADEHKNSIGVIFLGKNDTVRLLRLHNQIVIRRNKARGKADETIQFGVNDLEWENNVGHYKVILECN